MTVTTAIGLGGAAFLLALLTVWAAIPILARHVVDHPNERSSHVVPIPRAGGMAVALATGLTAGTHLWVSDRSLPWALALAFLIFAALGFVDDLRSLGVRVRLLFQATAGLLAAHEVIANHGWGLVFLSAFLVVGFVNAFNFMDGINGISAVSTLVAVVWYVPLLWSHSEWTYVALAVCLGAATLGFAVPNTMGRLFLGDVGSYFIGASLAILGLVVWSAGESVFVASAPLVLYVFETALAVFKRAAKGDPVGEPHRDHVYQQLVDKGLPHLPVAILVGGISGLLCVAFLLVGENGIATVMVWLALLLAYVASPRLVAARGAA